MAPNLRVALVPAAIAALILAGFAGCVHAPVDVSPSLAPVDDDRPIVRYKPIQGEACAPVLLHFIPMGNNSLLEALWDMKRLVNVDGYVEVSVETKMVQWVFGHTRCTIVTAYPFTYGTEPRVLRLRGAPGPESREPATSRAAPPVTDAPSPTPEPTDGEEASAEADECGALCRRFGELAAATGTIRDIVRDRCLSRCRAGDAAYVACARDARTVEDVRACNALP